MITRSKAIFEDDECIRLINEIVKNQQNLTTLQFSDNEMNSSRVEEVLQTLNSCAAQRTLKVLSLRGSGNFES